MRTSATRALLSSAVLLLLLGAEAKADTVFIDFQNGTLGTFISSFYSAQGVTFSNAQFMLADGFTPGPGNIGFGALTGPGPSSPIRISFATLQSEVSVMARDLSAQGVIMRAYGAGGDLLGQAGYADGGSNGLAVSFGVIFASPSVSYIELFQPLNPIGTTGGVVFDNLRFNSDPHPETTPEPATLILLGSGLGGTAVAAHRRRRARKGA